MDNTRRNIHNSGPLGMLVKSGQVKKVEDSSQTNDLTKSNFVGSYFKTQSGLEFADHELLYIDPKECEPWKYANRHDDELGSIDELIESIKVNKQLQPALVRKHPFPHGDIKYEIIFGRRRHIACLKLGVPFLVIRKDISNIQDAIASQDAENKFRKDVSLYSDAILYQRLLLDGIFKTEKELAEKLRLSPSTLNDLMAFSKIPQEIVQRIPNIYSLSKSFALKIMNLLNKASENYDIILKLAPQINKSITSPAKLEQTLLQQTNKQSKLILHTSHTTTHYRSNSGKKLFTYKLDQRGSPCLLIHKEASIYLNLSVFCDAFKDLLEQHLDESGYPD